MLIGVLVWFCLAQVNRFENLAARNETAKYEAAGGDAVYDVNEAEGEDEAEDGEGAGAAEDEKVVR